MVVSTAAPSTSGSSPRRQHAGVGCHHIRNDLVARRAPPRPAAWPGCGRGGPDRGGGVVPRRAHSASEASSARRARGASCSPEIVPCAAAAPVRGATRGCGRSRPSPATRGSTPHRPLANRRRRPGRRARRPTASSSTRSRRCSRKLVRGSLPPATRSAGTADPRPAPGSRTVPSLWIISWRYDTYRPHARTTPRFPFCPRRHFSDRADRRHGPSAPGARKEVDAALPNDTPSPSAQPREHRRSRYGSKVVCSGPSRISWSWPRSCGAS